MNPQHADPLNARLVDSLYTKAMLLADEARSYFEDGARGDRSKLDPRMRVSFSCESLKVTTRLMHIVAWLLTRRAVSAGELDRSPTASLARTLGHAATSDDGVVSNFPDAARTLIAASSDLYARIRRLEESASPTSSPARALMSRLERSI